MMLALKIPLIGLIAIVWWAVRQKPEDDASSEGDDGRVATVAFGKHLVR